MNMIGGVKYNERSWAIDLISHLKHLSAKQNRIVRDAGGEQTIANGKNSMYPDVLLFGDQSNAIILQGWELKMPEVSIDDIDFVTNAEYKARLLGTNSFVLWNVRSARLYAMNADRFEIIEQWDELVTINSRVEVMANSKRWKMLAQKILDRVNSLIEDGVLTGKPFVESYMSGGVTNLLLQNSDSVAKLLRENTLHDAQLRAQISLWWSRVGDNYTDEDMFTVLAKQNISNWIGKILFNHVLLSKDNRAKALGSIEGCDNPSQAIKLFTNITNQCNFWTVFQDSLGLSYLPDTPWQHLLQFNNLLKDLNIGSIKQEQLSLLLSSLSNDSTRKQRGQFTTPRVLARLLVECAVRNIKGTVLDPCTGSGTIARSVVDLKMEFGLSPDIVTKSIFANDIDPQAVQLATFSLARPELMNYPIRILNMDAFDLVENLMVQFRNPLDGSIISEIIKPFDSIVCNLPFISSNSGLKSFESKFTEINLDLGTSYSFNSRADISAYLPFAFCKLLNDGGRLGLIITNSWQSTEWGEVFLKNILRKFVLKCVITSGVERWFANSEVVTNIFVLEKNNSDRDLENKINFITLNRSLSEYEDNDSLRKLASSIELSQGLNDEISLRSVYETDLHRYFSLGMFGSAQFVNVDWILDIPLVPITKHFIVSRGERRGWDKLFYPTPNSGIEKEYLFPFLKNLKQSSSYSKYTLEYAFCCSKTTDELEALGHSGALKWIRRFEKSVNGKGKPLTEVLKRSNCHWYEMKSNSMNDIAMSVNYGSRLHTIFMENRVFLNQRLIGFQSLPDTNVELCHALMSSTIGLFCIEGIGSGRGMGVLNLSKDHVERYYHILDPSILSFEEADILIEKFRKLKVRDVLDLPDELEQNDRIEFDQCVLQLYKIAVPLEQIYSSLLTLFSMRQAAKTAYITE